MRGLNSKALTTAALAISTALLAGCGGGGGDGASTPVPSPAPAPAPAPAPPPPNPPLTTAPPSTYAEASVEAAIYRQLNAIRIASKAGAVAQSTTLDTAALGMARYTILHYTLPTGIFDNAKLFAVDPASGIQMGHIQTQGLEGFTGRLPSDRARAAGFQGGDASMENGGFFYTNFQGEKAAEWCVDGWMRSKYHRQAALWGIYNQLGIGVHRGTIVNVAGSSPATCYIALGVPAQALNFPSGSTITFPWAGAVIPYTTDFNAKGLPISVSVPSGQISANNFIVKVASTGALVPGQVLTRANDSMINSTTAFFQPDAPLPESTTFEVSFVGAGPNGAINLTWQFSTDRNRYAAGRPKGLSLIR